MNRSKICIVTPRSINDSPCLEKYKAIMNKQFDIIYWHKGGIECDCGALNTYAYNGIVPVEGGKIQKIKHYYCFMRFVEKIVKNNKYEKLIVYPTHMAWLLRRFLKKYYKGKYILDIRDYAGEKNHLINFLTSEAVNNSGLCTITSPAYKSFLASKNYIVSHNLQPIDNDLIKQYRSRITDHKKPIVISFIGTVRFLDEQKKLITLLGNDNRFCLKYIGRGSEALKDFCKVGRFNNVILEGQFDRNDIGKFYMDTDIANNVYGNDDPALSFALSNKVYCAAMLGMPILASPNTFTAYLVKKLNIGFVFDYQNKNIANDLFSYMIKLDHKQLKNNMDIFLKKVKCDEALYRKAIQQFLMK